MKKGKSGYFLQINEYVVAASNKKASLKRFVNLKKYNGIEFLYTAKLEECLNM